MNKFYLLFLLSLSLFLTNTKNLDSCTNFRIASKNSNIIIGRTMEFPVDLKSKIFIVPRGEKRTSFSDKGLKGSTWTSKFAYIGINGFGLNAFVDGINEKGLTVNGLMYSGAEYEKEKEGEFVTYADFGAWLLGNFSSTEEVKKMLAKIKITDTYIKAVKGSLGLHMAIHDSSGKSIVVEFIDGEKKIYDNKIGVMTNRPSFPEQLSNLRNYINLDSKDKEPRLVNGFMVNPAGAGSGMLGLPGDWTPPSRFLRMAYVLDAVVKPKTDLEAVNLAEHMINIVDIPKGAIREKGLPKGIYPNTQWITIYDLKNKTLYFRTYDNLSLRKLELSNFDISIGAPKKSLEISNNFIKTINVENFFN
jgi:choloylglycine hydrolase